MMRTNTAKRTGKPLQQFKVAKHPEIMRLPAFDENEMMDSHTVKVLGAMVFRALVTD